MREVRKTNCHFCGYLCAFHATVEDGRVVDLEPDPSRYPYDPKVLAGCRRWKMNLDVLDGDDRGNYPPGQTVGSGWAGTRRSTTSRSAYRSFVTGMGLRRLHP